MMGISSNEANMLLEMIGKNPFKVKNEVEKIKIYLNGEKFEISKMKNVVSVQKEYKIYEMTENIFTGKAQEVIDSNVFESVQLKRRRRIVRIFAPLG